ncbi:DUF6053 domain-containing protein [Lysobacter yananisis]
MGGTSVPTLLFQRRSNSVGTEVPPTRNRRSRRRLSAR